MNFGATLGLLPAGKKMRRVSMNGFIALNHEERKIKFFQEGKPVKEYRPTSEDMLASDWQSEGF